MCAALTGHQAESCQSLPELLESGLVGRVYPYTLFRRKQTKTDGRQLNSSNNQRKTAKKPGLFFIYSHLCSFMIIMLNIAPFMLIIAHYC